MANKKVGKVGQGDIYLIFLFSRNMDLPFKGKSIFQYLPIFQYRIWTCLLKASPDSSLWSFLFALCSSRDRLYSRVCVCVVCVYVG